MKIAIEIPEAISIRLRANWKDLTRRALEALAIDAYRSGVLTAAEVGQMLGHASRWETEGFLKDAHADMGYSEADLENDATVLKGLASR